MTDEKNPPLQVISGGTPKTRQYIDAMIAGDEESCVRIFQDIIATQPTLTVIDGGKSTTRKSAESPSD
ncbi:MAG: hypothetical protein R3F04_06995 [Lysobacteraceae bacterium]